jgi:hypothetical protein
MTNETQSTQNTGPISFDDVRAAVGDSSPFETNVNRLRERIGRGSFATIQKHLDVLRAQRVAAAQPETSTSVPKAPADAVEIMWAAAWGVAQTKTLARLEFLSAERDGLQAITVAQAADVSSLTEQLDVLDAQAQAAVIALAAAQTTSSEQAITAAVQSAAQAKIDADNAATQAQALAQAHADIARITADAAHAAQLATLTAQVERQALQSAIDRMHDQLAELKALHIVAATAHPAPATTKEKESKK